MTSSCKINNVAYIFLKHELKALLLVAPDTALPPHWDDMKGNLLEQVPLTAGSKEYNEVLAEVSKHGLTLNIIQVCCPISDMQIELEHFGPSECRRIEIKFNQNEKI